MIACDLGMRQFDEHRSVDIPKTVYAIRRDRAGAVQTKEQYAFIYRVSFSVFQTAVYHYRSLDILMIYLNL